MALDRTITATEFRAKCHALLDEVTQSGLTLTITKRGVPVAQLGPPVKKRITKLGNSYAGRIKIVGDIDGFSTADLWKVLQPVSEESIED